MRDGTMTRAAFAQRVDDYCSVATKNLLAQGVQLRLRGAFDALFSVVRIPGIDPTNNHAERALRPFVLWRKTSQAPRANGGFSSRPVS